MWRTSLPEPTLFGCWDRGEVQSQSFLNLSFLAARHGPNLSV